MAHRVGLALEAKDKRGETALIKASEFGRLTVVKALLAQKADTEAKDNSGETALIKARRSRPASISGGLEVSKALLAQRADMEAKDRRGETALITASIKGCDVTMALLVLRTDVEAKETLVSEPALMKASVLGKVNKTTALLEQRADA